VRSNHTGYKGCFGIYEVMQVSEGIRGLILESGGADELRSLARREGMRTLREDGLKKIQNGDTSVAEVLRVAGNSAR
jgi:type II secretory ATPase GspE/PulE/Tfp pilus assembly ATPase PilB-like protein